MKRRILIALAALTILYSCSNKDNMTPPVVAIEFTVSPDSVKVNPYGYTPLSAQVSFSTEKMGSTVLIVKGKHGAFTDVVHRFNDFGSYHSVPVIGMYADYSNTVLLRVVDNNGDTLAKSNALTIQTGSLPAGMPTGITAQSFDESAVEPGIYLVSNLNNALAPGMPSKPYMMDNYGDIRWVLDYSSYPDLATMFYDDGIARLRNGNFFFGDTLTDKIYEVDLLGKILNTWEMPGYGFHHEVTEKPDGNFLLTSEKEGSTNTNGLHTVEDFVIEINRQTGAINHVWDLKESLNEYRTAWTTKLEDWFHGNAVTYDSTDNTIIVSGRTQGVVKLDYQNNVVWILAPHADWGVNRRGEDLSQFLLQPLDASGNPITDTAVLNGWAAAPDFEWSWYQHNPILLPNGNLMIFDNGTTRSLNVPDGNNIFNSAPGKYSRAVEYKIDEANKTIQQMWDYGKERGQETYSTIISSVQFLPQSNNVLFGPGFNTLNTGGAGGRIVEVDYNTEQAVADISVNGANKFGFHRVRKISVYPANM
jgi:arylsulfate sulfotransferase